jgi:hypothetical protein
MKKATSLSILIAAFSLSSTIRSDAASAAFGNDAAHVFLLRGKSLFIADLNLGTTARVALHLPDAIQGIASSPDGLLVATQTALYRLDANATEARKLCSTPANNHFVDLAFDPANKGILLCAESTDENACRGAVFYLRQSKSTPETVHIRRAVDYMDAPVFDRSGYLFFAREGDLWAGSLSFDQERISLAASRYAPVATRETVDGTPTETGAKQLAPAGDRIYACIHRMGGSGWGNVVSIKKPAPPPAAEAGGDSDTDPSMDDRKNEAMLRNYISECVAAFSSLKICGRGERQSSLCSTLDERRTFFVTSRIENPKGPDFRQVFSAWLAENGHEPRPVKLALPDEQ